jgi:hypothetical protein
VIKNQQKDQNKSPKPDQFNIQGGLIQEVAIGPALAGQQLNESQINKKG